MFSFDSANVTLIGALAGIMWVQILRAKGITTVGYVEFLKYGILISPLVSVAALGVLSFEFL